MTNDLARPMIIAIQSKLILNFCHAGDGFMNRPWLLIRMAAWGEFVLILLTPVARTAEQ